MNLMEYNNKYCRVIDDDGTEYIGMCYYTDADTAEEPEDTITIKLKKNGRYCSLLESMVESIEILEK